MDILRMNGVLLYAMLYACTKLMNYSIMMWFPLYMSLQGVSHFDIGAVMILYEVSGMLGSFLFGWLSDALNSRVIPLITLSIISAPTVVLMNFYTGEMAFYMYGGLLGCSHIGISNIISSVVSIDLGKQNVGMVYGVIDGTASISAGVGMFLIGVLYKYSWAFVWGLIFLMNILAFVPLGILHNRANLNNSMNKK